MAEFIKAAEYLPVSLKKAVLQIPESIAARIQEIRLRLDAPLFVSTADREWMISKSGHPIQTQSNAIFCSKQQLEECFLMLCEYSVHTHQHELCAGFITARNGCRAGIAGTAVVENNKLVSVRNITSICIRVARRHDGCASELVSAVLRGGRLHSALICGEPSSGKSSLIRDLARQLSTGTQGRHWRTAVVDERGELSSNHNLNFCDVLRGYPKAEGIQQAVRCFAPDVVIFDELGSLDETKAVIQGLNSGVAAIATAHCRDEDSLFARPPLAQAVASGAFERVIFLKGRSNPGEIARVLETRDLIAENNRGVSCVFGRSGYGSDRVRRIEQACRIV